MVETEQQKDVIESSDINELEEIFARKTGQPIPQRTVLPQQPIIESIIQQVQAPIKQPLAPAVKEIVQVKPQQEIRTNDKDSFTPMDLPTRNLDKAIEDWAEKRKQHDIDLAYKKLTNMLFQPLDTPQPSPQQQQPQQPVIQQVLVKDNSEAIKLIDLEILKPGNKDLAGLINVKRRLQGLPLDDSVSQQQSSFSEARPVKEKKSFGNGKTNNSSEEPKKNYSLIKVGIPLFLATIAVSFGVIYALVSGIL